jgi:hypothetical protein
MEALNLATNGFSAYCFSLSSSRVALAPPLPPDALVSVIFLLMPASMPFCSFAMNSSFLLYASRSAFLLAYSSGASLGYFSVIFRSFLPRAEMGGALPPPRADTLPLLWEFVFLGSKLIANSAPGGPFSNPYGNCFGSFGLEKNG